MALRGTAIATAFGLVVFAVPAAALADQTGNRSNNPAVIQGQVPEETGSIAAPRAGMPMGEPMTRSRHPGCSFLGEEAGNRNPDYVQCFNN